MLFQNPANMAVVVADAEVPVDDLSNTLAGPEFIRPPVSYRTLRQQLLQLSVVVLGQPAASAQAWFGVEFASTGSRTPPRKRRGRHPKDPSDKFAGFTPVE
jgi:hypothetical protein